MGESWYYLPDKWEYRRALSIMRDGARILDIGCGKGFFLERCREKGISAEGIELNSSAAQIARSKGFDVHEEMLEVFQMENRERFDTVCLFQVLEHVADPMGVIRQALACVKPGGILIVGVPNAAGLMGKLTQVPANTPPHHVSRWSPKTIEAMASSFGLAVESMQYQPFHDHLPGYLLQRHFSWLPKKVQNNWLMGHLLFLPTRILRRVKPDGTPSVPGHTVIAAMRKKESGVAPPKYLITGE